MPFINYDIDFQKLVRWNTPTKLLKQLFLKWLYCLVYPIILLHATFKLYRKNKLYEIAMNFQVCYLEAFLNDKYDLSLRRIYIADALNQQTLYIYERSEAKPVFLFTRSEAQPVIFYTRGETTGDFLNDFIIFIPIAVVYDEPELRAMVATKLCGKRFKIELF
jgi:hypothetical protein